jgi:hypothetical protein
VGAEGKVDERSKVLFALAELVIGVLHCKLIFLNSWLPGFCLPATHRSHAGLRALKSPASMVLPQINGGSSMWSIVFPSL